MQKCKKKEKIKIFFRAWVGVPSIRMKPMTIVYYGNEFLGSIEEAIISYTA
jgi:hypothetical protein